MCRISWFILLLLRILILIFVSPATSMEFSMTKNANNYGPYNSKFYNYKQCSGPRSKNVTISSSTLNIDQYGAVVTYNVSYIMPSKIEEIKVTVWNVKGDQKNILWSYKVKKPCQHFVIAGMLEHYYRNIHNCVVPPGDYNYKSNYTEVAYRFFGNSFFYGHYSFKINSMATQGNIMCIQVNALFFKKV